MIDTNKKKDAISALEDAAVAIQKAIKLLEDAAAPLSTPTERGIAERDHYRDLVQTAHEFGFGTLTAQMVASRDHDSEQKIVEGVFIGDAMRGPDGRIYSMPANYASKSKLVEGDIMKLTIVPNGSFLYKQIAPVERQRTIGTLECGDNREYFVRTREKRYRVLTASITYYKGVAGDEVVVLTPKSMSSSWAAVDNIIKQV